MQDHIFVKGARENNLKNIDVTIPRDKLVVLTGLSGSGKSSLVNEILYKKLGADLNRVKFSYNPYNINRLTLLAGTAAMEDEAYFEECTGKVQASRQWTAQALKKLGFTVLDSNTNFLFAASSRMEGGALYRALKQEGILVRHFDAPRIQNWLRITIGTPEQMQTFMETLDKIMEE